MQLRKGKQVVELMAEWQLQGTSWQAQVVEL